MEIETRIDSNKKITLVNGRYHSVDDRPSMITIFNNSIKEYHAEIFDVIEYNPEQAYVLFKPEAPNYYLKEWHKNGILHRDNDLPAQISESRTQWYKNGKLHRECGPASINEDKKYK